MRVRFAQPKGRAVTGSLAVDVWEHEGRLFEVVMAPDVINNGMGLELTDLGSSESGPSLEAFWHDDGSDFDFIVHHAGTLPFAVVVRFVTAARKTFHRRTSPEGGPTRRAAHRMSRAPRWPERVRSAQNSGPSVMMVTWMTWWAEPFSRLSGCLGQTQTGRSRQTSGQSTSTSRRPGRSLQRRVRLDAQCPHHSSGRRIALAWSPASPSETSWVTRSA